MKKLLITPEDGAQEERLHLKRMVKQELGKHGAITDSALNIILSKIDKRSANCKKKAGGLKG